VLGVPHDTVRWSTEGMPSNGSPIGHTSPIVRDRAERPDQNRLTPSTPHRRATTTRSYSRRTEKAHAVRVRSVSRASGEREAHASLSQLAVHTTSRP
jgi:hypothetical protein